MRLRACLVGLVIPLVVTHGAAAQEVSVAPHFAGCVKPAGMPPITIEPADVPPVAIEPAHSPSIIIDSSDAPHVVFESESRQGGVEWIVRGRVVTPDLEVPEPVPVGGTMVTLHRVGRDSAGALDSVRTDRDGNYRFTFRVRPDPERRDSADAIYFASATYGGIAYFTAPFRMALTEGEDALITVFDTTSVPFPLSIRGRHIIVGALDSGDFRTVIEVFELSNDSIRTLISRDTAPQSATWSSVVPRSAYGFRVNETELSSDALMLRDGKVLAFSPFSPGLSQVSFSYRLPASDFPLTLHTDKAADVLEVLLEEPMGTVVSEGMTNVGNVNIEGRAFHRFISQDVPVNHRILINLSSTPSFGGRLYAALMLATLGVVMLLVLMRSMARGRSTRSGRIPAQLTSPHAALSAAAYEAEPASQERIAREIVLLDEAFARASHVSSEMKDAYEKRRAALREELREALARSRDFT